MDKQTTIAVIVLVALWYVLNAEAMPKNDISTTEGNHSGAACCFHGFIVE